MQDFDFSFAFTDPHKNQFAMEIDTLLSEGKSFMIKHKVGFTVFVPKELVSFYSGGDESISELNQRHVQHYNSIKTMHASIGMLIFSCKAVISSGSQLQNTLKLLNK